MLDDSGSKPRLLFVEDEAVLRDHLAQKLSDQYIVDTAGNGNEALLAVMRAKPALVVSDIVMPDMDGVELLKTLRQSPGTRAIPVLLISGRAADEHRIEGFEEGADGFLAKPYTERELRALIGSLLRSARLRADAAGREAHDKAEQRALLERATLLESITDGFYALDRYWRFTYVNQRALDFYGKERAELLGSSYWDTFPRARGSIVETQFKRALREPCSVAFETQSSLTGRWIEIHAYPTPQGLAVNFRDISHRKEAEVELQRTLVKLHSHEEQLRHLASEAASMQCLHELMQRLRACGDLGIAMHEVLDACIALLGADMGSIQLADPQTGASTVAAQRRLTQDFLEYLGNIHVGTNGVPTPAGQCWIVEDVDSDIGFARHRAAAAQAGFRAFQATVLTGRNGELLGTLWACFRNPHRPSEQALRVIDLYAWQAVEFIERRQLEQRVARLEQRLPGR